MPESKGTILLVDDDPSILMTVGDRLEFEGYDVAKLDTCAGALDFLAHAAPDLIILDIGMPDMSGLSLLKQITSSEGKSRHPVLVFTARANMESFFENTNVDGFIAKPGDPSSLLKEVERILAKRRTGERDAEGGAARRPRLIIAEDNAAVASHLVNFFAKACYDVSCVANAQEFIETVLRERPDVTLIKLDLPVMNGAAIASVLATMPSTRHIPNIVYDDSGLRPWNLDDNQIREFVATNSPVMLFRAVSSVMGTAPFRDRA